ncbi:MAG: metallopeptidase TldD-related protein [Myxococcota bacterium]|nr:metallopeptidase TldD-related protein [Myxococcota bacterium]
MSREAELEPAGNPYFEWFGVDAAIIHRVLSAAMERGAEFADLYFQHRSGNSIGLEDGIISRASTGVDRGVGIRVVIGDQTGYAYSEDIDLPSMLKAASTAASIAAGGGGTVSPDLLPARRNDLYAIERGWDEVSVTEKLPLLQKTEALVRSMDPHIEKVTVSWADSDERVLIATSDGALVSDRRPMSRLACAVTAIKDGEVQSNGSNIAARQDIGWYDDARLQTLCEEAVRRTMILFEARRAPAGEFPVVLAAGASGILLHEAVGHGMEADFNRKGTSIYASMIDQQVAPDCVTVVDSALHPHERGALNVDDEGNVTERTVLVEQGVMRTYLHDRISAKHYGVNPTGSGRRESFRHTPMPRMRCTYMENGPHTRDEIIESVKYGIVAETFRNGQVQIGAGDYTFYIRNGWLIEDGKITAPIKDCNIIGNGPESLRDITMVADDMKLDTGGWTCGKDGQSVPVSQGMPTVLVSRLTVGGLNA